MATQDQPLKVKLNVYTLIQPEEGDIALPSFSLNDGPTQEPTNKQSTFGFFLITRSVCLEQLSAVLFVTRDARGG